MKPSLFRVLVVGMIALPIALFAQATKDSEEFTDQVRMTIACTNSVFGMPGTNFLSLTIANGSTNQVFLYWRPVCNYAEYEVWLTNAVGHSLDIGFKSSGPQMFAGNMTVILPGGCESCIMKLPVTKEVPRGSYLLTLRCWCFIPLKRDANGKVVSQLRLRLVSNGIAIEVK